MQTFSGLNPLNCNYDKLCIYFFAVVVVVVVVCLVVVIEVVVSGACGGGGEREGERAYMRVSCFCMFAALLSEN